VKQPVKQPESKKLFSIITAIAGVVGGVISSIRTIMKLIESTGCDSVSSCINVILRAAKSVNAIMIHVAFAQNNNVYEQGVHITAQEIFSSVMIFGVFIIMFGCLYIVAISNSPRATSDRAWDMIKIIAGFFIGNLANLVK
jgi:hypothetical protein